MNFSNTSKELKRSKARLGSASINASDVKGLRYAWRNRQLVLFLGAGVSIPYGIPSWKSLVLELLFEQAQGTRRLGTMWPHYRRAVASWMADYFEYDPLVLARMVERDLHHKQSGISSGDGIGDRADLFVERLRAHMYANYREPTAPTMLCAIAELIVKTDDRIGVDSVVTFNFDDLPGTCWLHSTLDPHSGGYTSAAVLPSQSVRH